MIIISDTSVIINLARIDHLSLLPTLFHTVTIPEAVFREVVEAGNRKAGSYEIQHAHWITVLECKDQAFVQTLLDELDVGEAQAIGLALEQSEDVLLLMDEKLGRKVADRFSLTHVGILGILLEAKEEGIIPEVKPLMDRLIHEAGFFVGEKLFQQVLQLAGEG